MPRSFLVKKHFNSSKKPNYSELDTHTGNKTGSDAAASLLRWRSLRGSNEEGWDGRSGWRERGSSRLALFPFAYKEGVLRNTVSAAQNESLTFAHPLELKLLREDLEFSCSVPARGELQLLHKSFRKFQCFIVSGCTDQTQRAALKRLADCDLPVAEHCLFPSEYMYEMVFP